MRLMSYNIHKGYGPDRRYSLRRVLDVIDAESPDVLCLQEVDQNCRRTRFDDQPRLLAEHFQAAAAHFQLNVPRKHGGYGNLVLSRFPLVQTHSLSLRLSWRKPRAAQLVVVQTPEGPLHLVHWHLGLAERERRWQVNHCLTHEWFAESAHLPTVVLGDFNDWRNTLFKRVFARHDFHHATVPLRRFRSFPSFLAMAALDKFFHRNGVEVVEARIVRSSAAKRASDHLPLVVDLRVRGTSV